MVSHGHPQPREQRKIENLLLKLAKIGQSHEKSARGIEDGTPKRPS
jgi:hypothetical protein